MIMWGPEMYTMQVRVVAAMAAAAAVSMCAQRLYMAAPARWLCEFDEAPCDMHMPGFRGAGGAPVMLCRAFAVYAAAVYVFLTAGVSLWGGAAVVFLAAAAFSDMEYITLPDQMLGAAAACALAGACARGAGDAGGIYEFLGWRAHFTGGSAGFWGEWAGAAAARIADSAKGALASGGLMLMSAALSSVFYGSGAIGAGDIKMMLVCGALVGSPEKAVMMFAAAVMNSALFISAGIIIRRLHGGSFVPMAPFIALAAVIFM